MDDPTWNWNKWDNDQERLDESLRQLAAIAANPHLRRNFMRIIFLGL